MIGKDTRTYLGFNDTWLLLLGAPIIAFSVPLLFFNATLSDGLSAYFPKFSTSLMFTLTYWFVVRQIILIMRRRFSEHSETRKRLVFSTLSIIVGFFLVHKVLNFLHHSLDPLPDPPGVTEFDYVVASLTITLFVTAIYEGFYFYDRWRVSVIEQERLRRENIESQLAGLREQVNPHFLFNSLNTLVYLIQEDPIRAVQFVRKLSKVYRYVLEMRDKRLIPLSEELKFLESYVFLIKERFGENLRIELDIPDSYRQEQVVPLSLQMLFENAIKHNIISRDKPLDIHVGIDQERLVVSNNLQVKQMEMASTGVGLENIKSRYAFFSEAPILIEKNEQAFRVSLPLLKLPVRSIT